MMRDIRSQLSASRDFARRTIHVAVLTPCSFPRIRAVLPFPIGLLYPGAIRALLVVTRGTKLRTFDKFGILNTMKQRSSVLSRSEFYLARLYGVAEIKGLFFR